MSPLHVSPIRSSFGAIMLCRNCDFDFDPSFNIDDDLFDHLRWGVQAASC